MKFLTSLEILKTDFKKNISYSPGESGSNDIGFVPIV